MALKYFETDGGTLAVEVSGSGPLVICSPGMGDKRDSYSAVAAQLVQQGYCVAQMDNRGHGDSTAHFNRYGDEATADDFLTIIDGLNLGPAVLVGCSFSSAAAVIAAGKQPSAVAGLVLTGAFLRNPMGVFGLWMAPLFFLRPYGPWVWKLYAANLWQGLGDKATDRAIETQASLTRPKRWAAFQATVAALDHRQAAPWISRVEASVLVLMGDKDPDWSKPLEEAEWVASNFEDAEVVAVPGAGHGPAIERPQIVVDSILEYLNKVKSKGAFQPRER